MSSELKNKLYNHEVIPPANVWDNIAFGIPEPVDVTFQLKLYNFEVTPPANTWNIINGALDEVSQTPIFFRKKPKIFSFLRYAAAAAIAGIIVFLVILVMNADTPGNKIVKESVFSQPDTSSDRQNSQDSDAQQKPASLPSIANNKKVAMIERKIIARAAVSPRAYTTSGMAVANNTPVPLTNTFSIDNFGDTRRKLESSTRNILYDLLKPYDRNSYITLIRPDGYIIRMSKKIVNMLDCMYNLNVYENMDCKDQMSKWRVKIAQSPITPSSVNFLDILDLIKSIHEN